MIADTHATIQRAEPHESLRYIDRKKRRATMKCKAELNGIKLKNECCPPPPHRLKEKKKKIDTEITEQKKNN